MIAGGNSNIRRNNRYWSIDQALDLIAPQAKAAALAAVMDGKTVTLAEKIRKDCTLRLITAEDEEGKVLLLKTAAFFTAAAIWELSKEKAKLTEFALAEGQFRLEA